MMKYSFRDYNEYYVLKVPFLLFLLNLYLFKHFLIFVLPLISQIPWLVQFAHQQFNLFLLLSSLPAVLVIISMSRRLPKTRSILIRWIWQQGRQLLLISLILELIIIIFFSILDFKNFSEFSLMVIYIDVISVIFLLKSQRVQDVFAEFPAQLDFSKTEK